MFIISIIFIYFYNNFIVNNLICISTYNIFIFSFNYFYIKCTTLNWWCQLRWIFKYKIVLDIQLSDSRHFCKTHIKWIFWSNRKNQFSILISFSICKFNICDKICQWCRWQAFLYRHNSSASCFHNHKRRKSIRLNRNASYCSTSVLSNTTIYILYSIFCNMKHICFYIFYIVIFQLI